MAVQCPGRQRSSLARTFQYFSRALPRSPTQRSWACSRFAARCAGVSSFPRGLRRPVVTASSPPGYPRAAKTPVTGGRTLRQVRAEDHTEADLMFTTLMGDQVEPRRKFIEDNALDVKNLDV